MTRPTVPVTLMADFYKVGHRVAYPKNTQFVYSTWIPRESRNPAVDHVVAFGFQMFIKEFLIHEFQVGFFDRPVDEVCAEYERLIRYSLNQENPDSSHLRWLHGLGYLPLEIRAVPEGTLVPLRVPMLTIENTEPEAFWVTNFIETLFSCEVWHSCTSATTALEYRKLMNAFAAKTGGDLGFVPFQGHDFSMRGHTSLQSAAKSGAAHLLSFVGTDTIPAICYLEKYYNADIEKEIVGTSIPATEHSVECAHGQDEYATVLNLITNIYPAGFVSRVCDTWDFFAVLTDVLPRLKDEIMARDGKLVVRPDSGNPVDILCGTTHHIGTMQGLGSPEEKGAIELLWDTFGGTINAAGYKELDSHIGCIYGDSITYERAKAIFERLEAKGFASTNVVLGIGSFTYQYTTRDHYGFALKSTWVRIESQERNIFKDPVTDIGHMKKSLTGRVVVSNGLNEIVVSDGLDYDNWLLEVDEGADIMEVVYRDGKLIRDESLAEIRARVLANA